MELKGHDAAHFPWLFTNSSTSATLWLWNSPQAIVTNLLLTTVSVIVSILGNSLHPVIFFICGPTKTLTFLSQTFREELFEGCTLSKYSRDKLLGYWSNKPFRVSNNIFHTIFNPLCPVMPVVVCCCIIATLKSKITKTPGKNGLETHQEDHQLEICKSLPTFSSYMKTS